MLQVLNFCMFDGTDSTYTSTVRSQKKYNTLQLKQGETFPPTCGMVRTHLIFKIPFSCQKRENIVTCHYPFTLGWYISLLEEERFEVIEVYITQLSILCKD